MSYINDLFRIAKVAGSGLRTNRQWMGLISNNIANTSSLDTGAKDVAGNYIPFARQVPVFSKVLSEKFRENKVNEDVLNGVQLDKIVEVTDKYNKVWDPSHPAARKAGTPDAGYVYYPAVSIAQEMADMKLASASYEANLSIISASGKMMQQALSIGRR